jgi:hypothetical protein
MHDGDDDGDDTVRRTERAYAFCARERNHQPLLIRIKAANKR